LVELEMTEFTFRKFLLLMLSRHHPVPTLTALPTDQLVTSLEWGDVTLGVIPAGSHLLPAKVSVKINHVGIAELEAWPGTPEHTNGSHGVATDRNYRRGVERRIGTDRCRRRGGSTVQRQAWSCGTSNSMSTRASKF